MNEWIKWNKNTSTQIKLETKKVLVSYPDNSQKVSVHCE